jgi:ParB family chromosome partitioning protein
LAIDNRHKSWAEDLPQDDNALWDTLAALDGDARAALLAHCVSFGVNALYEKPNPYGAGPSTQAIRRRLDQADRLARAIGLDMDKAGWRATVDNYLGRVTKPRILDAVREAKGETSAQLIDHLKKGEMAKEAERLLDGAGWLPEPLRLSSADLDGATSASSIDALPDFLADDDEADADFDDEPPAAAAAR